MNAADLLKKANETFQRHVTKITSSPAASTRRPVTSPAPAHTSSVMTSRADDIIASLRHGNVAAHYDDVNIPSDSYFTGDEEVPVWNVPDYAPLLDNAAAAADATSSDEVDDSEKLLALAKLLLAQFSPFITANASKINAVASGYRSHDGASLHKLVTSSVSTETSASSAGYHADNDATELLQAHVPLTTTLSPPSQVDSRPFATMTTTHRQPANQTRSASSRDRSHVIEDRRDVTTMTSTAVQDVHNYTLSIDAKTAEDTAVVAAAAAPQPQPQAAAVQTAVRVGSAGSGRQLGGFGQWGGGRRHGMDYFDFFDYVVDYQTPRPPRRRLRLKTGRRRKTVKPGQAKSGRVRGQAKPGQVKQGPPRWPKKPRSGPVDQLDVVVQSYDVEVTGAGSEDLVGPPGRRGRSQRRRLTQSLPGWIVRDEARDRPANVHEASGAGLLKEGKRTAATDRSADHVEPIQRRTSTVHGDGRRQRTVYTRPIHRYVHHQIIPNQQHAFSDRHRQVNP